MKNLIGVDIGGSKIEAAIVSAKGAVLRSQVRPTPTREGARGILDAVYDIVLDLTVSSSIDDYAGIGIGTGGQINPLTGQVLSATGLLPGWGGIDLKEQIAQRFPHLPVAVDNDVNALASGEYAFGVAKGLRTVLFLALGTGVGGAILLDGQLHHGVHGAGGEFGHLLIDISEDARIDGAGDRGTLEAYCSGGGLVQTWREITGKQDAVIDGREIAVRASADPNGTAAQAIARTGQYLGYGLVSLANILDPDLIVIGGGLAQLGDALLDPARRILQKRAMAGPSQCPVIAASLGEHASVIGAASLAMDR